MVLRPSFSSRFATTCHASIFETVIYGPSQVRHISRNSAIAKGLYERPRGSAGISRRQDERSDRSSRSVAGTRARPPAGRVRSESVRGQSRSDEYDADGRQPYSRESPMLSSRSRDERRTSSRYSRDDGRDLEQAASRSRASPDDTRPRASFRDRDQKQVVDRREGATVSSSRFGNDTVRRRSRDSDDMPERDSRPASRDAQVPFSIPYTTAASVFITGTRAVSAALKAQRRQLYKLFYAPGANRSAKDRERLQKEAKALKLPTETVTPSYLDTLTAKLNKKGDDLIHDGVVLEASPLPQKPTVALNAITATDFSFRLGTLTREHAAIVGTSTSLPYSGHKWRKPFLLWLHGIVDTRNLGAVARTALYFGVDALVLTSRATASVDNPAALRASAGALEFMPVLLVPDGTNPLDFMAASQENGWHFVSAVAPLATSRLGSQESVGVNYLHSMEKNPVTEKPTVLVLGNEDLGLPKEFVKKSDETVSIRAPGKNSLARQAGLDSLNVSIAGAILCECFLSQKAGNSARQAPKDKPHTPERIPQEEWDKMF